MNTCSGGGAIGARQTRLASEGSAQAKSKSRKLDSQLAILPLEPGCSYAESAPSSSSGPHSSTQDLSASCGLDPTPTHASSGACSSGSAVWIRHSGNASEGNYQCPSARLATSMSSTQAPLNACHSGGASRVRQTRPASGESAQAESKSRKLASQPFAGPSCELLAKLAERFLHQKKHPKGDG